MWTDGRIVVVVELIVVIIHFVCISGDAGWRTALEVLQEAVSESG